MQEKEFENRIMREMQELEFGPPDHVWKAVQKAIAPKRDYRRFLWLPLAVFMLLSGGYFYCRITGECFEKVALAEEQPAGSTERKIPEHQNANSTTQPFAASPNTGNKVAKAALPVQRDYWASPDGATPATSNSITFDPSQKAFDINKTSNRNNVVVTRKEQTKQAYPIPEPPFLATQPPGSKVTGSKDTVVLVNDSASKPAPSLTDITNTGKAGKSVKKQAMHKPGNWQFGIYGGYGVSAATGRLLHFDFSGTPESVALNTPGIINMVETPETNSGAAFNIGLIAEKPLSNRFSVSMGFGYGQYTSTLYTGARINSNLNVSYNGSMRDVGYYYRSAGFTKYTSRYHVLELPVAMHVQLNRSTKLPLIWDAGMHLQQVIGNNALYADTSGNYFSDKSLVNKTQWGINTGLSLKLFNQKKVALVVGPEVKINLSRLNSLQDNSAEHLDYLGLKTVLLFGSKKVIPVKR